MLFWTQWIPLTPATIADLSDVPGLYEVKVDSKDLVPYPTGKSAMIYYGITDQRRSLQQTVREDWFTPEKEPIRREWEAWGPLVFRWAATETGEAEHARRVRQFVERFGRIPFGNAE